MARQLVFTSVPQGLTPGRTGFCTVARHRDLRERLVPALEGFSIYPSGLRPAPVICQYRRLDIAGASVAVLSRIADAGHDYTQRTNFLAHHLILEAEEIAAAPAPADIFLHWTGWLNRWDGPPRWLDHADLVDLRRIQPPPALPAAAWKRLAGDAGRAALLVDQTKAAPRRLALAPGREAEMLELFRESSALLGRAEVWDATFTNWIPPADALRAGVFRWQGLSLPAGEAAPGGDEVLNLNNPSSLPPAPPGPAARRAREGATAAASRTAAAPPKSSPLASPARPARAPGAQKSEPAKTAWMVWTLAGLLAAGLVALAAIWLGGDRGGTPAAPQPAPSAPAPPIAIAPPASTGTALVQSTTSAPPAPAPSDTPSLALANDQRLQEIRTLASGGKYFDALAKWRELETASPDLARAHAPALLSTLRADARTEWLARLAQLETSFDATPADSARRAELQGRLDALRALPAQWNLPEPAALAQAADLLAAKLAFAARLPGAPVWLVDGGARQGGGGDYEEFSATVNISPLRELLAGREPPARAALAQAPSLELPPAGQWFEFKLEQGDFGSGDYLVLHDYSRAVAGGRFLQILAAGPGEVRLTWRAFAAGGDFFAIYPQNAPLRATARRFWLRLTPAAGGGEFYLLVRQPGTGGNLPWSALRAPFAWLAADGAPARVRLPPWLGKCLQLQSAGAPQFWLAPDGDLVETVLRAPARDTNPAATPGAALFQAQWLAEWHEQQARNFQTDLARARQGLSDLEKQAADERAVNRPDTAAVDRAFAAVAKLEADIAAARAAAQAASRAGWPAGAAPWRLSYGPDFRRAETFLDFPPDATGPTP